MEQERVRALWRVWRWPLSDVWGEDLVFLPSDVQNHPPTAPAIVWLGRGGSATTPHPGLTSTAWPKRPDMIWIRPNDQTRQDRVDEPASPPGHVGQMMPSPVVVGQKKYVAQYIDEPEDHVEGHQDHGRHACAGRVAVDEVEGQHMHWVDLMCDRPLVSIGQSLRG